VSVKSYKGRNDKWGVRDDKQIIYTPNFEKEVAQRLAELEQRVNPPTWEEARKVLIAEGLISENVK
jgi:hypothetical protein